MMDAGGQWHHVIISSKCSDLLGYCQNRSTRYKFVSKDSIRIILTGLLKFHYCNLKYFIGIWLSIWHITDKADRSNSTWNSTWILERNDSAVQDWWKCSSQWLECYLDRMWVFFLSLELLFKYLSQILKYMVNAKKQGKHGYYEEWQEKKILIEKKISSTIQEEGGSVG